MLLRHTVRYLTIESACLFPSSPKAPNLLRRTPVTSQLLAHRIRKYFNLLRVTDTDEATERNDSFMRYVPFPRNSVPFWSVDVHHGLIHSIGDSRNELEVTLSRANPTSRLWTSDDNST